MELRSILFFICTVIVPSFCAQAEDSWTYNKESPDLVDLLPHVTRWCGVGKTTPVYSNVAIPGRHKCGPVIESQSSCDANGNRFISSKRAPYAFLDCSLGNRIEVQNVKGKVFRSGDPLPDYNAPIFRAPVHESRSKSSDYMDTLDKLLDKKDSHSTSKASELLAGNDLDELLAQFASGLKEK